MRLSGGMQTVTAPGTPQHRITKVRGFVWNQARWKPCVARRGVKEKDGRNLPTRLGL